MRLSIFSFLFSAPLSLAARDGALTVKVKRLLLPLISRLRDVPAPRSWPNRATWYDVGWNDNATEQTFFLSTFLNDENRESEIRREGRHADLFHRCKGEGADIFTRVYQARFLWSETVIGNGISDSPTLLSRLLDPRYCRFYWRAVGNVWKEEMNLGRGKWVYYNISVLFNYGEIFWLRYWTFRKLRLK